MACDFVFFFIHDLRLKKIFLFFLIYYLLSNFLNINSNHFEDKNFISNCYLNFFFKYVPHVFVQKLWLFYSILIINNLLRENLDSFLFTSSFFSPFKKQAQQKPKKLGKWWAKLKKFKTRTTMKKKNKRNESQAL